MSGAKKWKVALRGLVAVAIVAFVLSRVPLRDVAARLATLRLSDIVALVALGFAQQAVSAVRWWRVLVRLGERPRFRDIFGDVLVGALFNTFLPTSFGGDVVRAFRAGRRLEQPHRAWSSSLYERLLGMLAIALAGALGVVLAVGDILPTTQRVLVVAMAVAFVLTFFFASTPLRLVVRFMERRLSSSLVRDLRGVVHDLEGPLATSSARLETFGWSVLVFVWNAGYIAVSVRALGAPQYMEAAIVGLPIVSVLSLAPISLGGHGLREGLFVFVYGLLGVPADVAFGVALLGLACLVFFALLGAVVAWVAPTPPLPDAARAE